MNRFEIVVPPLGESLTQATLGTVIKGEGAFVRENEEIVELETEKVNQPLYAPREGIVHWVVQQGDTVSVGDVIAYVEESVAPQEEAPVVVEAPPKKEMVPPTPSKKEAPPPAERPVVPQKEAPPPAERVAFQRERRIKMTRVRKLIATRLVDSLRNAAVLTTFNEVDMSAIMDLRARHKEDFMEKYNVKLGLMSFFVKAVVDALKAQPIFNSYIDGDEIVHREYYDIGVAVGGAKGGLLVPVLHNCDQKSYADIEKEIAKLASKARDGTLTISEIEGGGFTITNGGIYGSLLSTPLLNPPQCGILGMHKIDKRAVVENDTIVIRPMMYLALSYDHRLADGKEAVTFLVHIKEMLQDPSRLLLMSE